MILKDKTILTLSYEKNGQWKELTTENEFKNNLNFKTEDGNFFLDLSECDFGYEYKMGFDCIFETKMKLKLTFPADEKIFHIIPCLIFGDNNYDIVKKGEYPILSDREKSQGVSSYWEFRADRSAAPLSFMASDNSGIGVSIDPYSDTENGYIRNGIFSELPKSCGVTLGYTNLPLTFVDKGKFSPSTEHKTKKAVASGSIYLYPEKGRLAVHEAVRKEYFKRHERAAFKRTYDEAIRAITDTILEINWCRKWNSYTDMTCKLPLFKKLKYWRPVYEIGWTGIAELAGPLCIAKEYLGLSDEYFSKAKTGLELFGDIIKTYNEKSGLFNDLTVPTKEGSAVNGWWAYYGVASDCHCAYNVGKAVFEILRTADYFGRVSKSFPDSLAEAALKVLGTIENIQKDDGNFGYTYETEKKGIRDDNGFAGCWFLPSMVLAFKLTNDEKYLKSAEKASDFYHSFVSSLNCFATPMDTWKAVDEEGNLAFIKGMRLLFEVTENEKYLRYLEDGANYEYLWRYGFASRPEHRPIKDGWNSCGGSVTSVSNPHIHPMGTLVNEDLRFLSEKTKDEYHRMRADDSTAWAMQCLELYPEKTGYGRYGVLSERWCPSDGLLTEKYMGGKPYSSWFSFNLWATANVLEDLLSIKESS